MTGVYGQPANRQEMIRLIYAAVEHSVTLFDTAEAYAGRTPRERPPLRSSM